MQTDTIIQTLFKSFQKFKWTECENEPRLEWYFAEDNHYVVHDKITKGYWFIIAKSPAKACESVATKLNL